MRKGEPARGQETLKVTFLGAVAVMLTLLACNLWFVGEYHGRRDRSILSIMEEWPLDEEELEDTPEYTIPPELLEADVAREDSEMTRGDEDESVVAAGEVEAMRVWNMSWNATTDRHNSGILSCAEKSMGFSKFHQYMRDEVVLCNGGLSKINCPSFYPREDGLKRAFFCYLKNAFEVMDPQTQQLHWVVQCKLNRDVQRAHFFQDLAKEDYMRHVQVSTTLPSKLTSGIVVVEREDWTKEQFVQDLRTKYGLSRQLAELKNTMTYAVNGDCNTGNPGHCQADPQLLFIVQKMLGFHRSTTRLILLSGFGRSNYLAESVVQKVPQFFSDLQALAASIFIDAGHKPVYPELLIEGPSYVRALDVLSTSPFSLYGPHWQGFRENRSCEAPNPMLMQVQAELLKYRRQEWMTAPTDRGYDDLCEFMRRLESFGEPTRVFGLDASCAPPFNILYWVSRHGNGRHILNEADIVERLYNDADLPFTHYILANPGLFDYKDQSFLATQAHTIVGPHGGGMWEAARWSLRSEPRIKILEILPMLGPGDSCVLATMMGAMYKAIECKRCKPNVKHSADLEYEIVKEAVVEPFPPFSCKSLKEPKPKPRAKSPSLNKGIVMPGLTTKSKAVAANEQSKSWRKRLRGPRTSTGIG